PETGPEQASVVAERVRIAVERGHIAVDGKDDLTLSIGVGSYPEHGINTDELFERADSALYEVKRTGRNAVSAANAVEAAGPGVRFGIDVPAVIEQELLV